MSANSEQKKGSHTLSDSGSTSWVDLDEQNNDTIPESISIEHDITKLSSLSPLKNNSNHYNQTKNDNSNPNNNQTTNEEEKKENDSIEIENNLNTQNDLSNNLINQNLSNDTSNDTSIDPSIDAGNSYMQVDHEELIKNLESAIKHKNKGNEFYKSKAYDEAIEEYTEAISLAPNETEKHKQYLSIFYGNRAACYLAIDCYEETIDDCTISLENNENYIKAFWRRAQASEKISKYTDASNDYKKILEIDPKQKPIAQRHIDRLEPKVKEEFEKQTQEVVGKLKTFANWGLGKIGLSLDNFEAKQDPTTGGYNIQFNPNANQSNQQNQSDK